MCGEHGMFQTFPNMTPGSSPHVRGARRGTQKSHRRGGIIPACAGSTASWRGSRTRKWDHPRMCGEHTYSNIEQSWIEGSSPHVRGAPVVVCHLVRVQGIIPACAGSTVTCHCIATNSRDHPRMCGEHVDDRGDVHWEVGSSPHVRGAPPRRPQTAAARGIIPACAGSTRAH